MAKEEKVNHPKHYGGDAPYEAVKVIDAWGVGGRTPTAGFALGNALKYIARAGLKTDYLEDLRKAKWYLQHEIDKEKERNETA